MHRAPLGITAIVALMAGSIEAAGPPPAADADPLHAPACVAALKTLQGEETGLTAGRSPSMAMPSSAGPSSAEARAGEPPPRAARPALVAARRQAAIACLASRADPPPAPQRMAQPPIAVAPVGAGSTAAGPVGSSRPTADAGPIAVTRGAIPAAAPAVAPAPPSPASPPPAPTTILSCDTLGCWANDGSRLNRVGPNLWGPRGSCTAQGPLLQCP